MKSARARRNQYPGTHTQSLREGDTDDTRMEAPEHAAAPENTNAVNVGPKRMTSNNK
jgi:hypothetical protein